MIPNRAKNSAIGQKDVGNKETYLGCCHGRIAGTADKLQLM